MNRYKVDIRFECRGEITVDAATHEDALAGVTCDADELLGRFFDTRNYVQFGYSEVTAADLEGVKRKWTPRVSGPFNPAAGDDTQQCP